MTNKYETGSTSYRNTCYCHCLATKYFSTLWTVVHQAPLSTGFLRQEYWSGASFPSPEDLPIPGIKLTSPALASGSFTSELPGRPHRNKDQIK